MKRYFLLIFLIALFSAGSVAAVEISAGFSQATLSKNEVLVTDKAFSLAQVQAIPFLPAEKTQINLKPGESVWMRVRIDSQMATNISLVARYEFPWTDRAEFFVLRQTGEVVAYSLGGDAVQGPRAERLPLPCVSIARDKLGL